MVQDVERLALPPTAFDERLSQLFVHSLLERVDLSCILFIPLLLLDLDQVWCVSLEVDNSFQRQPTV